MSYKKNISIAMAAFITVQATMQPVSVFANETEIIQEETPIAKNPVLEEDYEISPPTLEAEEEKELSKEGTQEDLSDSDINGKKEENTLLENLENSKEIEIKEFQEEKEATTASHVISKSALQRFLKNGNITAVKFTDETIPGGVQSEVLSAEGQGEVRGYVDGNSAIITTAQAGVKIQFPADSSDLFWELNLVSIDLSNVDTSQVTSMNRMFSTCRNLVTLDLSGFDTSKVTDMRDMFDNAQSLVSITGLENFNTDNVTNMGGMFFACLRLSEVNVSNFNTSNVTNMTNMFGSCRALQVLDLRNFDTSKTTNMLGMFNNCSNLRELNVSSFNTSNVTNMHLMFGNLSNLTKLDISNFDTSKVTTMYGMFRALDKVTQLDLRNFDTSNVTIMDYMFFGCSNLRTIYSSAWNIAKVTRSNDMFTACNQLVGVSSAGIKTPFNATKINADMATPENGYFTVPGLRTATVKFVDENGVVKNTADYTLLADQTSITESMLQSDIPQGYELVKPLPTMNVIESGQIFEVKIQEIIEDWTATVKYVTATNKEVGTHTFTVTNKNPNIPAAEIIANIPQGYIATGNITDQKVSQDNEVITIQVELKEVNWTTTVKYVNSKGEVLGTKEFRVTNLNPVLSAQSIEEGIPNGYEAVGAIVDLTATQNGQEFEVRVQEKEVEWTVTINYVNNTKAVVGSATFKVTNLNPVVSADQVSGSIPQGYEAVGAIHNLTASQNGQIFEVQVQPVTAPVVTLNATVNFVDQNGNIITSQAFVVTNQNPVITVAQLQDVVPVGVTLVNPLEDLMVATDGEVFNIAVIVNKPVEDTWTITVNFKNEAGVTVGNATFTVSSKNPVITVEELKSKLPAGYTLQTEEAITIPADSVNNGVGTIDINVTKVTLGTPDNSGNNGSGTEGDQGKKPLTPSTKPVHTATSVMKDLSITLGVGALALFGGWFAKKKNKK